MKAEPLYQMLEARRRNLGLTQTEVSELAFGRADTAAIQHIRRGHSPSVERMAELCRALDLEFYIGPKRRPVDQVDVEATAFVDQFDLQVSAGAGSLDVAQLAEPVPFNARWLRGHGLRQEDLSILEVRGDSMEPVLYAGDALLVDKQKTRPKSGEMYVVVRRDAVQVKWVTVLRNGFRLVSENDEAYPPERVEPLDEPAFHRVRWFGHFIS